MSKIHIFQIPGMRTHAVRNLWCNCNKLALSAAHKYQQKYITRLVHWNPIGRDSELEICLIVSNFASYSKNFLKLNTNIICSYHGTARRCCNHFLPHWLHDRQARCVRTINAYEAVSWRSDARNRK